ncbi:hypothetical protein, partial [Vibrio diabolicus]|uniref:hypothetical protein n=1 Tax=Vibrio diabolicus TaxID=50719 RepID=UPI003BF8EAA8|nr:hypothetical protein [Vibrio diabolicus]
LAEQAADARAAEEAAALAEEEVLRAAAEQSMVVEHLALDLAKMTSAQLATVAEKYVLNLKQGTHERVDEFRVRVRDGLRAQQSGEL